MIGYALASEAIFSLLTRIEQRPSPNHDVRPIGKPIDILLLHYTGMPSADGALAWLRDAQSRVSCHYFVFETGRIVQLVEESWRAWHAGLSSWSGESDINSRSIGIEIVNPGHEFGYCPFPEAQIDALIELCHGIVARHHIPPERVLAHSDVAPLRKEDPGELFPWRQFHCEGIGHWVPPDPVGGGGPLLKLGDRGDAVSALQARLREYGYGLAEENAFGPETAAVVRAFQRHFRPRRVDGIADASTVRTLDRLIVGLPTRT